MLLKHVEAWQKSHRELMDIYAGDIAAHKHELEETKKQLAAARGSEANDNDMVSKKE